MLKDRVIAEILPQVQTPGQYTGGELNAVRKDHRGLTGKVCLAFPDTYAIGMSNHGLQVLYAAVNRRDDWVCERVFAPWPDMERLLRERGLPLYSLESFTPIGQFDVLGFTLQYELGYSNVLTILDLGGIPARAEDRTLEHPLVIAGGPCVQNPQPMSPFIDLFVIGDGEQSLPAVAQRWVELKRAGGDRVELLGEMARGFPFVYVPQLYQPRYDDSGHALAPTPNCSRAPQSIRPAVVDDLDALPLPVRPIVPNVECVQDRIAIEIMRGCPWRCRFCQATTTKRPLRYRKVETLLEAALESYHNTGYNDISLLSLSTSDYPHLDELITALQATFRPMGVSLTVPSLRVNEQLRAVTGLLNTDRRSGLTLAPEAARDDMRTRIGKQISNDDLLAGCRQAFENGFQRVKLYFMCGLPGERPEDLDGIIDMAEEISRLGRQVTGRPVKVVANVSNFVPKPHTPYQWTGMQTREYFLAAHQHLHGRRKMRSVQVKCHDIESSLLEGVFCRGDRRAADAIELAWRRGARFDAWSDHIQPKLWWEALHDTGYNVDAVVHCGYPIDAQLPWDPISIHQGRGYLEREHKKSLEQLGQVEM